MPRPPSAGVAGPGAPIKSDMALSIFQMADQDATSTLSLSEFEDLVLTVEPAFATEQIAEIFQEIVCDDELCKESISFLTSSWRKTWSPVLRDVLVAQVTMLGP